MAWIETVNHDGSLTVSEDSASGNGFDWRRITRGAGWPTGFIHFPLRPVHRRAPEVNHHSGTPLLMDLEAGGLVLNGELADPTSTADPTTPDWQPLGTPAPERAQAMTVIVRVSARLAAPLLALRLLIHLHRLRFRLRGLRLRNRGFRPLHLLLPP